MYDFCNRNLLKHGLKYLLKHLPEKKKISIAEKSNLHPRNPHRFRYNFEELTQSCDALTPFVFVNKFGIESIDFANPDAVKMLNKAILKKFYDISDWDIPENYLCPPIPGRADYIHYVADLLASENGGEIPIGDAVRVLDIGVGANCVYPIIGTKTYEWHFVGSDIDKVAIQNAQKIVSNNNLNDKIECRLQSNASHIFKGIILPDEKFDVSICNPPFHASLEEANVGTQRKIKNLGEKVSSKTILNFGGQSNELWCKGGEKVFIISMIRESALFANQCKWFTTLVSKQENLPVIYNFLKSVKAVNVRTINMAQGQKISRVVAWRF